MTSSSEFQLERQILKIGNALAARRDRELAKIGLTSAQSESLLFFEEHEGATIIALKAHLGISHQAARNSVERLRQKGLLVAELSRQDARSKNIHLTMKGHDVCCHLKEQGALTGVDLLQFLTDEEKQVLAVLLGKINRQL